MATRLREWLDPSNTGEVIIDQYPPNVVYAYNSGVSIQNIDDSVCGNTINPRYRTNPFVWLVEQKHKTHSLSGFCCLKRQRIRKCLFKFYIVDSPAPSVTILK